MGHDCSELWKKPARKSIRGDNDPIGNYRSAVGYDFVAAAAIRDDPPYVRPRV
jgi:hypothetical protein